MKCQKPPDGWWCSREPGHEGPCAARRVYDGPLLSVTLNGDGFTVSTDEPTDDQLLWLLMGITATIFGSLGGLLILIFVGFWSSILGFVFAAIFGLVPGFLIGGLACKHRKKERDRVSQVRTPDGSGVHPEVPVPANGEAAASVAVQ